MSVKLNGVYIGNKKVEMTHGPSGVILITDAPKDNAGDDSSFSPTDLVGAALGSCMLTTMLIYAMRNRIKLKGAHFEVEKHMLADPRRIGAIQIAIHLPINVDREHRVVLERVAKKCPVKRSLHPDLDAEVKFVYDVE